MHYKKVNPIVGWWMTPKLPYEDIYELPLLKSKSTFAKYSHLGSQWLVHPIKRRLARIYLKLLQKFTPIKVIGVTGSAGKSSTVGILESILGLHKETIATPHSIDPVYNIPNTILRCKPSTKYLILEMSVEYPGEMDYYLWLGVPDIGVILNIFPSHLANFKDVEGVFKEKSKLVHSLGRNGVAVLNSSDPKLKVLTGKLNSKIEWFEGSINPLRNNTNAANMVCKILGVPSKLISQGTDFQKNPKHRLEIVTLDNDIKILDDSYNSNPSAAISALSYFEEITKTNGRKIAVLGDMLELGDYEKKAHEDLGKRVSKMNFYSVVGVGKAINTTLKTIKSNSKKTRIFLCEDVDMALDKIKPLLKKGDWVFVKGSRSIGLDKLVSELSK